MLRSYTDISLSYGETMVFRHVVIWVGRLLADQVNSVVADRHEISF